MLSCGVLFGNPVCDLIIKAFKWYISKQMCRKPLREDMANVQLLKLESDLNRRCLFFSDDIYIKILILEPSSLLKMFIDRGFYWIARIEIRPTCIYLFTNGIESIPKLYIWTASKLTESLRKNNLQRSASHLTV